MIGLTMFLFGGMWIFELQMRKTVECFKWDLMHHLNRSMEDIGAGGDLKCGGLAQGCQRRRILECLPKDHFGENDVCFLPYQKSLPVSKAK